MLTLRLLLLLVVLAIYSPQQSEAWHRFRLRPIKIIARVNIEPALVAL